MKIAVPFVELDELDGAVRVTLGTETLADLQAFMNAEEVA